MKRGPGRGAVLWKALGAVTAVGLLGWLLFPASHHREIGHPRRCEGNLVQLGSALTLYAADYDQTLPPDEPRTAYFPYLLHPYTKNATLWKCPDDSRDGSAFDGTPGDGLVSYGYNALALVEAGRGLRLSAIKQHAATVALVDSTTYRSAPSEVAPLFGASPPVPRHRDMAYVLWLDGHMKAMRLPELEERVEQEGGMKLGPGIEPFRYWNRR